MERADILVGRYFVGHHGGKVVDFGAELLVFFADFGELGVDGV